MAAMQRPRSLQTVGQTITEKTKENEKSRKWKPLDMERVDGMECAHLETPTYVADIPSLPYRLVSSQFEEGEERIYVAMESWQSPKAQELVNSLLYWMNDVLSSERIVLTDLIEDLYDGLILRKLLERLANVDFGYSPLPLATLNKEEQLKRLRQTLAKCAEILNSAQLWDPVKWTAEAMRNKNAIIIIQLAVAVAIYFQAAVPPLRQCPPGQCQVRAMIVRKHNCHLYGKLVDADLIPALCGIETRPAARTSATYEHIDAFDTLFDHAPEKLNSLTKTLIAFANRYLNKLKIQIIDINTQFRDGVNLILLIGLLEGYFVPFSHYHISPKDYVQKLENARVAISLMDETGIPRPKCLPEDIVNGDAKCILRTLFVLYNRYHRI